MRRAKTDIWLLIGAAGAVVLAWLSARFWLLHVRGFDQDEFEHLHVAWYVSKGLVPYRDFFENHTPALHYFLAPFFSLFDVERDVEDAFDMMFLARKLMWVLTGLILGLTAWLGRIWKDWRAGVIAVVFLANSVVFLEKSLEVRPDLISVSAWTACLAVLLSAIRSPEDGIRRRRALFAVSGALLAVALLATQKILLALPGFGLTMLWYWLDPRSHGSAQSRSFEILAQFAGFCLPIAVGAAFLASSDALEPFIEFGLLFNLGWPREFWPWGFAADLMMKNPVLVQLSAVGLGFALLRMHRREEFERGDFVLALNTLGLGVGLFVIPAAYPQYYTMLLPLMAIFAASSLIFVATALAQHSRAPRAGPLSPAGSPQASSSRAMTRDAILAGLIILLSITPALWLKEIAKWRNDRDLAEIAFILENTAPDDTVMDGWRGVGLFRPHADFFWMLPPTLPERLPRSHVRRLVDDMESGVVDPAIVNLDPQLRGLDPDLTRYIMENYEPVGLGDLRVKKNRSP